MGLPGKTLRTATWATEISMSLSVSAIDDPIQSLGISGAADGGMARSRA